MGKYEIQEQRRSDIFDKLGYVSGIALLGFAAWAAFFNPAERQSTPKAPIEKKIETAQPFVTPNNIYDPRNAIIVGDQADGSDIDPLDFSSYNFITPRASHTYVIPDDITKLLEEYGLTRDRIRPEEMEQK